MKAPEITDYFPKSAKPGERVQIIGSNFASDVVVLFDGIEAKITMIEKDVLTAEVPQEMQEGDIKLFRIDILESFSASVSGYNDIYAAI